MESTWDFSGVDFGSDVIQGAIDILLGKSVCKVSIGLPPAGSTELSRKVDEMIRARVERNRRKESKAA